MSYPSSPGTRSPNSGRNYGRDERSVYTESWRDSELLTATTAAADSTLERRHLEILMAPGDEVRPPSTVPSAYAGEDDTDEESRRGSKVRRGGNIQSFFRASATSRSSYASTVKSERSQRFGFGYRRRPEIGEDEDEVTQYTPDNRAMAVGSPLRHTTATDSMMSGPSSDTSSVVTLSIERTSQTVSDPLDAKGQKVSKFISAKEKKKQKLQQLQERDAKPKEKARPQLRQKSSRSYSGNSRDAPVYQDRYIDSSDFETDEAAASYLSQTDNSTREESGDDEASYAPSYIPTTDTDNISRGRRGRPNVVIAGISPTTSHTIASLRPQQSPLGSYVQERKQL
ncbi:hypothetical protein BC829DRAFT_98972 [Chytridium lagenaria]|nr:hypothetical protein BC829DRAFT_98972 [Chytridium lagenaria]